jgi:hypothetical protein
MTDDIVTFTAAEALVSESDVLQAQGMPPDFDVTGNLKHALETGRKQFEHFAEPVALCSETDSSTFTRLFLDNQGARHSIPLDIIVPKASRLVLFVLTLGPAIDAAIEKLFADHEYTSGLFLDTYASLGVSRLINLLEKETAQPGESVLAYCPGYCGWPVTVQRELLKRANADRIGVTLNDSCLMSPIKSGSGVLISGIKTTHQFTNNYSFCADCTAKTCRHRLASMKGTANEKHAE